MKTIAQSERLKNYRIVQQAMQEKYVLGTFEGNYISNHLWELPEKWLEGMAKFIQQFPNRQNDLLHDLAGFINKEIGFAPRSFRGGSVWDKK